MTRDGLPAPHERLARMRKSFKRNKTVLTEDYEYSQLRMHPLSACIHSPEQSETLVKHPDKHGSKL